MGPTKKHWVPQFLDSKSVRLVEQDPGNYLKMNAELHGELVFRCRKLQMPGKPSTGWTSKNYGSKTKRLCGQEQQAHHADLASAGVHLDLSGNLAVKLGRHQHFVMIALSCSNGANR